MASKTSKKVVNCAPGQEFVFRMPSGVEVGRVKNIKEFFSTIRTAPLECVVYHANGNHFSPWLEMIGESKMAAKAAKVKGNDGIVRRYLLSIA